jgi:cytochrome c556
MKIGTRFMARMVVALVGAGALASAVMAEDAAVDVKAVRAEREAGFKANKRAVALIKDAIKSGDMAAIAKPAQDMAAFGENIPGLFPPGSQGGFFSPAKPQIWGNFADFQQKAQAFQTSAQALADEAQAAVSGTGDKARVEEAFKQLTGSCAACHDPYRRF